jgi:hypothetical protein
MSIHLMPTRTVFRNALLTTAMISISHADAMADPTCAEIGAQAFCPPEDNDELDYSDLFDTYDGYCIDAAGNRQGYNIGIVSGLPCLQFGEDEDGSGRWIDQGGASGADPNEGSGRWIDQGGASGADPNEGSGRWIDQGGASGADPNEGSGRWIDQGGYSGDYCGQMPGRC